MRDGDPIGLLLLIACVVLAVALLLGAGGAYGVDVRSITWDEQAGTLTLVTATGRIIVIDTADYTVGDLQQRRQAVIDWLQGQYDIVVKRNTLPADDPDRLADPATACAFWSAGANITYRGTIVRDVLWDGVTEPRLVLEVCSASP